MLTEIALEVLIEVDDSLRVFREVLAATSMLKLKLAASTPFTPAPSEVLIESSLEKELVEPLLLSWLWPDVHWVEYDELEVPNAIHVAGPVSELTCSVYRPPS